MLWSQWDGSFKHPKLMLKLTDKKIFSNLRSYILLFWIYWIHRHVSQDWVIIGSVKPQLPDESDIFPNTLFSLIYSYCSKISNTFLFQYSNKMLFFRAEIQKLLVRISNREDPDQTASSEAVWSGSACLWRPYWQATSVRKKDLHCLWRPYWQATSVWKKGLHCLSRRNWQQIVFKTLEHLLYSHGEIRVINWNNNYIRDMYNQTIYHNILYPIYTRSCSLFTLSTS